MKRYGLLIVGLVLLFAVSCSSTPEAAEAAPESTTDSAASPGGETTDTTPADGAADGMSAAPRPDAELTLAETYKKAIEDYGLSGALPEEYRKGNEELDAAKAALGSDNAKAKASLDSALARYQAILDIGMTNLQKDIAAAKSQADTMKAAKAAAAEYAQGEAKAGEFKSLADAKKYQDALTASGAAVAAFNQSFNTAKTKRDAADREILKTDDAQKTTDTRIDEVTKEIGGEAQ